MKRALSIILIFIALTNIVGFMPLYYAVMQEIKSEVDLKMADGADLQDIVVTNAEYADVSVFHISDEHEFKFKGRMYDYKAVKKTADGYIFYALQDNKESNLVDFVKNTFDQSNGHSKNTRSPFGNLLKNFSKDFIGHFSGVAIDPTNTIVYAAPLPGNYTSAGYFNRIQNPPDTAC